MKAPQVTLAIKQMRQAANNVHPNVHPQHEPLEVQRRVSGVLNSLACYLEYGDAYIPQLKGTFEKLIEEIKILNTLAFVGGFIDPYDGHHTIVCFDVLQSGMNGRYVALDLLNKVMIGSADTRAKIINIIKDNIGE